MKNSLVAVLLLVLAVCRPPLAPAQRSEPPLEVQIPMLVKVLTYDRKLSPRPGMGLTIGIIYQGKYQASRDVREKASALFDDKEGSHTPGGLSCTSLPIDIDREADLGRVLSQHQVDMLFVAPLQGVDVQHIARIGHQEHILTTTSVPDYVREGIEVSVSQLAGKPRILINLASARAAGADFGAGLLKMATVIQGDSP